jgi:hypothetical protein
LGLPTLTVYFQLLVIHGAPCFVLSSGFVDNHVHSFLRNCSAILEVQLGEEKAAITSFIAGQVKANACRHRA